jgi:hypothetical protein
MTQPMYFVQGPKEVVMILTSFNDVRHIFLTDKHSPNVKPSWYGESIGHYEGDSLVVDTIGLDDRTWIDGFGTPHTKQLHVIERFHLIEDGKVLEANVHVEDPGAFTMPWDAIQRFRQYEAAVRQVPVELRPRLAAARRDNGIGIDLCRKHSAEHVDVATWYWSETARQAAEQYRAAR